MTLSRRTRIHRLLVAGAAACALALSAPRAAVAFCPTTTCKKDCKYQYADGICETTGKPLKWTRCVSYSLDVSNLPSTEVAEKLAIIDNAFRAWYDSTCPTTGKHPSIQVRHAGEVLCNHLEYNAGQGNANVIIFRRDWPYQDDQNQLGLTTVTFDPNTGELLDADMELNFNPRDDVNFSNDPTVANGTYDLQSVMTHEVGHFLGFGHVPQQPIGSEPNSVMFPYYDTDHPDLRSIKPDDIDAVCATYESDLTQATLDCAPRNGFSPECALNPNIGGWCAADANRLPRHGAESALVASALLAAIGWRRRKRHSP